MYDCEIFYKVDAQPPAVMILFRSGYLRYQNDPLHLSHEWKRHIVSAQDFRWPVHYVSQIVVNIRQLAEILAVKSLLVRGLRQTTRFR